MLRQNFMKQTVNRGRRQYTDKARKYMKEYMDKGYLCGQAAMKALAGAYEMPLCQEIIHQSMTFTEGGGVGDRCAVFQASLALIGMRYGRSGPEEDRETMRRAAAKLAVGFRKEAGSYHCRDIYSGDREACIQSVGRAADILSEIFEEKEDGGEAKTV